MNDKATPFLKRGDIIIANEDIASTGMTFYIWKNHKYELKEFLPMWKESAWRIQLRGSSNYSDTGYFSERELFEKFDCLKWSRKQKLLQIKKNL